MFLGHSPVKDSLLRSVPHFLIGLFYLLKSSSLFILDISPLSDMELVKISFCGLPFCPVDGVLCFTEVFQCPWEACPFLKGSRVGSDLVKRGCWRKDREGERKEGTLWSGCNIREKNFKN